MLRRMKRALLCILVAILPAGLAACGKSPEQQAREDVDKASAKRGGAPIPGEPTPTMKTLPPPSPKADKPPAAPEPTTPEEIEVARKQAMIDGRDKDVIKYCEQGTLDAKTDPQVYLGCTLAACRIKEEDKARAWGKGVAKSRPLLEQAKKVCLANNIAL